MRFDMVNLLFPGRHHLLTDFQFKYIYQLLHGDLKSEPDVNGKPLGINAKINNIIFAITSANHSNTRRNPIPLYQRAMAIQEFASGFEHVQIFIYDIDDVGCLDDFADYTIKRIKNRSDGRFSLAPDNTVVLVSTPVLELYEKLGFKILPAELIDKRIYQYKTNYPGKSSKS